MDEYFHLNLRKFSPETALLQGDKPPPPTKPPPSMPSGTDDDKDAEASESDLELEVPLKKEDNSDPYNKTGRFNIKDVKW